MPRARRQLEEGEGDRTAEWYVHVQGFKSIRDRLDLQLRPLTLLCGGNSSGKTSALQPLLLLKQTLEVAYDPGPLLLSGENVNFSNAAEMLWHGRGKDVANEMTVGLTDFDGESTTLSFRRGPHGVDLEQLDYEPPTAGDGNSFTIRTDSPPDDLAQAIQPTFRSLVERAKPGDVEFSVERRRCFFDVMVRLPALAPDTSDNLPKIPASDYTMLGMRATNLIHLPGLRDNPSRFYPATQYGESFPGVFQPYVASVIVSWGENQDPRLSQLGDEMQQLGLSWKVEAKRIDDTRVALRVGRLPAPAQGGARDMVNIADVGLGVSQTLPVLVALHTSRLGQIVYLEQPEIHLHPRAQVALAGLLLNAARRGVVVIAETHSYLLLRAIQETAARTASTHLVKLHWFDRGKDGATRVTSGDLDKAGAFGDWPADFADVELDVEERYVQTALGQLAK